MKIILRQWRLYRKLLPGNRGAVEFLLPKLISLLSAVFIAGQWSSLRLLIATVFAVETALMLFEMQRQGREGFTRHRARRCGLVRLGLAVGWAAVVLLTFGFLGWGLALSVALLGLLAIFGAYLAFSAWLQIKDMVAIAPADQQILFEQVRQMQNLPTVINQMQTRLLVTKDRDSRRDLTFYLGWAETYAGHLLTDKTAWEAALKRYQAALDFDPCNQAARAMLAVCYAQSNEFELSLRQLEKAVTIFNGQYNSPKLKDLPNYDEGLWHWHRNEVSSEYEQSAGLFQLATLVFGLLQTSQESGAVKELLGKEITAQALKIPQRSQDEFSRLLANKAGRPLSALGMMCSGPQRAPATPLELLNRALTLPLLHIQIIETAA